MGKAGKDLSHLVGVVGTDHQDWAANRILYRALGHSASEMRERNNTVAGTELLDANPMVMKERVPRSNLT